MGLFMTQPDLAGKMRGNVTSFKFSNSNYAAAIGRRNENDMSKNSPESLVSSTKKFICLTSPGVSKNDVKVSFVFLGSPPFKGART